MNSYGVQQFDKIQLRAIAIGKQYDKKAPSALTVSDDLTLDRDLNVERDTHIARNLFVGKGSGSESMGKVNIIGELSVSGNTFLGTNVQTTTIRNDIVVQDTLSVAGSVTVASCQNELPSNFMEFTRTRHANDDNIHVAIQEGDSLGSILFKGSDGTDWKKYVDIQTIATSTELDNEGGKIKFNVISGGGPHSGDDGTNNIASYNTLFSIGGENKANSQNNEVVVNEAGINTDFRVKTDQKDNMFFVDSLANKIGIDLPNPQFTLDIQGDINISNRSYVGGTEYKGGQVKRDSITDNIESVNFIEGKLGFGTLNPDYDVDIVGILNVRNKIITKDLVMKGSISFIPDTVPNDLSAVSHALILTGNTYTDVITTALNRTQFSIENPEGKSINMGVLLNGNSIIQVVDDSNPNNYNSISIQPIGGKTAIGKENPNVILDIGGNDSIKIPVGNTAERPVANSINQLGYIRYNTDLGRYEGYGQNHNQANTINEWISLGGLKDVDNDTYITVEDSYNSDNDQIKFFVEDRQEMTLDKSGYLGIGVTSPNARLHIESNDVNYSSEPLAIFKSQTKDASIRVEGKGESYIEIANSNTTGDTTNSWGIGMNDDKNLYFNWKTNGTLDYDTNINERNAMTIMQNGNVGINKSIPDVTFDIEGEDAIRIPRGTTAQRPASLGLGQIRYNTQLHTFEGYGAGNAWGSLGGIKDVDRDTYITAENSAGSDNDELRFYTAQFEENVTPTTVPRMIIKNDGDIGINMISPTHKLHVNGTLGVEDSVTLSSTLDVTGITNINNNLGVTGNITIDGTVGISGATTVNSTINISGNATFDSNINRITFKDKTYIEGKDSDYLKIITNNSERLMISKDGDIGIGKSTPTAKLDINGTLIASGATTLQSTLDITASTSMGNSLSVTGTTTLDNTLNVSGATTIDDTLTVTSSSILNDTLQVSGTTTLNSTLSVSGVSQFSSDLTTMGKISARHTTRNVGVEITPFGGNSVTNGGGRVFFRETDNSNTYGFSLGFNGGEGLDPPNLAWPSNTFCISRHNGNSSGEVVLAIERGSNNVGLGTGIPTSNLHIKQTSGSNDCMIKLESDGGNGSNKPQTGIEFVTNDGNPTTPSSSEPTYTSSKILSGWNQGEDSYNQSYFKIQTHHLDSTLNDSFTIKGQNVGINNNTPLFTLDIDGTFNTTGATTINNTLGTTGATTLGSTLGVTGTTTLGGTLGVTGETTLGNTLGVTGATTLSSTLGVTGATTLSSTLGVTGATTLSDTLAITGNTTVGGKLGIGTTSPSTILSLESASNNTLTMLKSTIGGSNEIDFRVFGDNGTPSFSTAKIIATDERNSNGGTWHSKLGLSTSSNGNSSENMTIDYNGRVGIKNTSPNVSLDITGNDAVKIPIGTTLQRPTAQELGQIRYNTQLDTYEGYGAGNAWGSLGGVKDVDRDTFISAQNSANDDNDELKFFTAQSEDTITATTVPRMIIKNDGKVGLNNISPSHLLHVNGTSRLGDGGGHGTATFFGTGDFYIHHGSSATYNGDFSAIQGNARNVVLESNQNIFVKSSLNNIIGNTIIGLKDTTTDQLHVEGSTNITGATNLESTLDVAGASILSNTLEVTGETTLNSSLSVASQAIFNGNAETLVLKGYGATPHTYIGFYPDGTNNRKGYFGFRNHNSETISLVNQYTNGNISLGNNTNITGTLGVSGAATLGSLDVTGNTQMNTVDVSGTTSLGNTLDITGATTINNTLSVGNNLFIESNTSKEPIATFKTTGADTDCSIKVESNKESYIELANINAITGDVNNSWGIGTNNDKNLHFNYKNNGTMNDATNDAMTILSDGKVGIGKNNPTVSLDVNGSANIVGNCIIGGDLQFGGEAQMSSSLSIAGDADFDGGLTIGGSASLKNSLDVTLATTLQSTLSVTGVTTLKNDLNVNNVDTNKFSISALTGNVSSQGTLNIVGATTLSNTLGVTGATTLSDTLGVTKATTLSDTLGVTGATTLSNTLGVTGATTLNAGLTVTGGVTTIGSSTSHHLYVKGNNIALGQNAGPTGGRALVHRSVDNTLILNYNNDFSNGVRIGGAQDGGTASNLIVTGATTLSSTLGVTGATTLSDTLGVTGATTLSSTLDVTGAVNLIDVLTLGTAPEPGDVEQSARFVINSRASATGANKYDRKADIGNLKIVDYIENNSTNDATSVYSKTILTNKYTNPYSGILLFNGGDIEINAMKYDWQHFKDLYMKANNYIWSTGSSNSDNGSTERMKLLENGNLGIGVTSPATKLHVSGTGSNEPLALFQSAGDGGVRIEGGGEAYLELANTSGTGSSSHSWGIGMNNDKNLQFNWKNNNNMNGPGGSNANDVGTGEINGMTLTYDGKVGIGTNSPDYKLHLDGTFKSTGAGTFDSNLDIGGTLDVTGATTLSQSLTTNGNFNVNNKFNVVSASGNTTISGTTNSQGKLTAGLATGTSLQVEGESLLKKKLTVNLSSGLGLDVKSNANIDGTLQVDGATTLSSTLNVTGNSDFNGFVTANLRQKGALTNNYIEYYQGTTRQALVGYSGDNDFYIWNEQGMNVKVNNDLIITGSTTLQNTLTVSGNTTLSQDLTVNGHSTITGDLTVNGNELRVNGNLFVSGTTTTINTTNMTIQDKDIVLASNATNNAAADGAGFIIEAGTDTDKEFTYSSTGDKFTTNIPLQIEDALIYGKSNEYVQIKKESGTGFIKMWEEIYLSSPNSDIYFQTAGANRMFINNSGSVGIGTTSPNHKLDVNGTFRALNSDIVGTLGVTGATTLSDTLGVTGATTLSNTLGVTGATTLSDTLGVTGATTLSNTLGVTGATTLSNTLGVTGETTLSNTLGVTGATTLNSSLSVASQAIFNGNAETLVLKGYGATPHTYIGFYPDGTNNRKGYFGFGDHNSETISIVNEYTNANISLGNNTNITGTLGVTGATTLSDTLGVTGVTTLSSTLGVTGATTLSNTLGVTGDTTLGGELTVGDPSHEKLKIHIDNNNNYAIFEYTPKNAGGTFLGKGELSFGGSQTNVAHSTGDIQFNTAFANRMIIKNDGSVGIGITDPGKKLDVNGTFRSFGATSLATEGGAVNISKSGVMTTVKGTLNVDQAVTLDTTLSVTGDSTFNGYVTGNLRQKGALTDNYIEYFQSTTRQAWVGFNGGDNFYIKNLQGGNVEISNNLQVTETLNVTKSITIGGVTQINNNLLKVTGTQPVFRLSRNSYSIGGSDNIAGGTIALGNNTFDEAQIHSITKTHTDGTHSGALCLSTRTHTIMKEAIYIKPPTYIGPTDTYAYTNANYACGNVGIGTTSPTQKLHVEGSQFIKASLGFTHVDADKILLVNNANKSKISHSSGWSVDYHAGDTTSAESGIHRFMTSNGSNWAERMRITAAGSVGIGTTSPDYKLDVRGQISCQNGINIDPDSNTILINTARHIGHQDNWTPVQITYSHQGQYGGNLFFNTHGNDGSSDNNVSTKMSIFHNGNVGIGTNSPSDLLHLKSLGDVVLRMEADSNDDGEGDNPLIHMSQDNNGVNLKIGLTGGNDSYGITGTKPNYGFINSATTGGTYGLQLATENKVAMTINEQQNIGIGTNSPKARLHVYDNSTHTELFLGESAANNRCGIIKYIQGSSGVQGRMEFSNYGNHPVPLTILNSGDVGIGTTSPTHKLDVNGTFRATGATTLTGALDVTGDTFINNNVGIRTRPAAHCSLDISSISDTQDNVVRIRQPNSSHNSQIRFTRLTTNGDDYGPEILFDKNQSPTHSVDSLCFISTSRDVGMIINWDGKVGIGGVNSTGEKLFVNGNTKISGDLDITGTLTVNGSDVGGGGGGGSLNSFEVDFSGISHDSFAAIVIKSSSLSSGLLKMSNYHEFFIGTDSNGWQTEPNNNFIKVQASGGGGGDRGSHANVEYGTFDGLEWQMLAIYDNTSGTDHTQDIIVYLRGGVGAGSEAGSGSRSIKMPNAGKYTIYTNSTQVDIHATDSDAFPFLSDTYTHSRGTLSASHYLVQVHHRLFDAKSYMNSSNLSSLRQFRLPRTSTQATDAIFDFQGTLRLKQSEISGNNITSGVANFYGSTNSDYAGIHITEPAQSQWISIGYKEIRKSKNTSGGGNDDFLITNEIPGQSMIFKTNNAEQMRIKADGTVGIGTDDPKEKLHVNGSLLVDTYEDGAGGTNGIFFRKDHIANNVKYNVSILTYAHADSNSADGLSINGYDGVSICTGSNARQERMRIDWNGNVGIGTTNPLGGVHITKTFTDYAANATGMAAQDTASRSASWDDKRKAIPRLIVGRENAQNSTTKNVKTTIASIDLFNYVDKLATITGVVHAGKHMPSIAFNTLDDYLGFSHNDYSERMIIRESGNVGIGTTAPVEKLQVSDSVRENPGEEYRYYSSVFTGDHKHSELGTTDAPPAWVPYEADQDTDDYSTNWAWVDLGAIKLVSGVITQKRHNVMSQYVSSMKIMVSVGTATGAAPTITTTNNGGITDNLVWGDGTTTNSYVSSGTWQGDLFYTGHDANSSYSEELYSFFNKPVYARYVKIFPTARGGGTHAYTALRFGVSTYNYTNNLMRITGGAIFDGNVCIGTTNPGAYKLNVEGNTKVNGVLDITGQLRANGSSAAVIKSTDLSLGPTANAGVSRALVASGTGNAAVLVLNWDNDFKSGVRIGNTSNTKTSDLRVTGDVKVDGNLLLQGGQKFHIGSSTGENASNTPDAVDSSIFMISGQHNTTGTTGTMFKINGYDNEVTSQKVIRYINENNIEDYYFKSRISGTGFTSGDGGFHYYKGSIGIGTEDTSAKLSVKGTINCKHGALDCGIKLIPQDSDGSTNGGGRIFFKEDSGSDTMGFSLAYNGGNPLQTIGSVLPSDTFGIIRHKDSSSGEVAISIKRDSTQVGIGTSNPQRTLHVSSDSDTSILISTTGGEDKNSIIYLGTPNSDGGVKAAIIAEGNGVNTQTNTAANGLGWGRSNLHFCLENSGGSYPAAQGQHDVDITDSKMMITPLGNVGIGTTDPQSKLHVAGTAKIAGDLQVNNSINFSGDTSDSEYDMRQATGGIASYSFFFRTPDVTQQQLLFVSQIGPYSTRSTFIFNSGKGIASYSGNAGENGYTHHINSDNSQYFQNNTWHHIVVSAQTPFSGPASTNYKVYVDSVLILNVTSAQNVTEPYGAFITGFKLGNYVEHYGNVEIFTGDIKDIYIFSSTITASQVTELYNGTLPSALSSNLVYSAGICFHKLDVIGSVTVAEKTLLQKKLHVKDNNKDVLQAYNDPISGAGVLRIGQKTVGVHGGTGSEVGSRIIMSSINGDDDEANDTDANCVIECREWGTTERQELLLFCGNDIPTSSGADRIRLKGAEILLDTYSTATSTRTNTSTRLKIDKDGKVGIGTNSPTKGALSVNISTTTTVTNENIHAGGSNGNGQVTGTTWHTGQTNSSQPISIYATQGIWTEFYYFATSDQRIKTNIEDVPDELALQQVRNIPCRYYNYIDKSRGNGKTIGFIAQEVKDVLPSAVTTKRNTVPDIYKNLEDVSWTEITNDGETQYNMSCELDVVANINYKFYVSDLEDKSDTKEIEVTANSDNTFTFEKEWKYIFCYGKEVDDFNILDKNKIYSLHHAAIQQLDKTIEAEKQKTIELQSKVTNLQNKNFGENKCAPFNNITSNHYGLIVCSRGDYINIDNSIKPQMNDTLPICQLSSIENDQRVFGIVSNKTSDNKERIHINSVGEGGIWVCNKNGNISNGNYITTCSISGYGTKQSDNILYNYSVAKITCDCDFKINRQTKMRVKVRNVVTTKQVPETTTKENTTTEFKIEYNEELQRHIRREIVKTVSEEVNVMEEVDLYDEQGNIIYDEEGNTIKHSVQKMKTIEENRTELVYDENGNIQYEKDITEDGEEQFEFKYDTRFLLPDGTLIPNKEEYITRLNNGQEVYIACFVGCSYHCS